MTTIATAPSEKSRPNPVAELPPAGATLDITDQEIALRAFELYCERGCEDGHDLEDWLRAEQELRGQPGARLQES
jgi:hypothetical protein